MYQTTKQKQWTDESGTSIPINRITKAERVRERHSNKILKEAERINAHLTAFKKLLSDLSQEAFELTMTELNSKKKTKGNFTWYNFDRSIKIEVNISERIEFDDLTINACKEKLDEFIEAEVVAKTDFVKEMIMKAFEKTNGKLDSKRVMPLLRYKSRISSPLYQEAMTLLESSIRRPHSKTYFRVWTRQEDGSYDNVDLNLSSL